MNNSRSKVLASLEVEADEQFITRADHDGEQIRDAGAVKTGRNAQRSLSDRFAAFRKAPTKDEEASFPVDARSQKRAAKAADRRNRRKGQRNYIRREWAREREVNQLATLFAIVDRKIAVTHSQFERAQAAIEKRVEYLVDLETTEDTSVEDVIAKRDEVVARLRELAATR